MSVSKEEMIGKLQHYQVLFNEYNKDFNQVGLSLFKKESINSSLQHIIQLIAHLEDMAESLYNLFQLCDDTLENTFRLLMIKTTLLISKIRSHALVLNGTLVITRADDSDPPSFESMQRDVGWCLDAVVFYKESVYYLNHFHKELYSVTVPENKLNELRLLNSQCPSYLLRACSEEEKAFLNSLPNKLVAELFKTMDYIDVVNDIIACLPYLQFKQDYWFQKQMFYALQEAQIQMKEKKQEKSLAAMYSLIMQGLSTQCSDNIAKLGCYFTIFCQACTDKSPLLMMEYSDKFFDTYHKLVLQWNKLQREGALMPSQKIDYLNANCYAYHIKLCMHPGLLGYDIRKALDKYPKAPNQFEQLKKCFNISIALCEEYFAKNADMLLCGDIQEIIIDADCVLGYINSTKKIGSIICDQITNISDWWKIIRDRSDNEYSEKVYSKIVQFRTIISQYYTTYDLINDYLIEGNNCKRFFPQFHDQYTKLFQLFNNLAIERHNYGVLNLLLNDEEEKEARGHAQELLAIVEKESKKTQPRKTKAKPASNVLVIEKKVSQTPRIIKAEKPKTSEARLIDQSIELGQAYIGQNKYKEALPYFWKAFNLASATHDIVRTLSSLDGLCCLLKHDFTTQIDLLKQLAQYNDSASQIAFSAGINQLFTQLPKIREKYNQYYLLANTHKTLFSSAELEGIAFSQEIFWKLLVNTQAQLTTLLNTKNKANTHKKTKNKIPALINPFTTSVEHHFDDLAHEQIVTPKVHTHLLDVTDQTSKQLQIHLPKNVEAMFSFLAQFKGKHYLVGSLVIQLVSEHLQKPTMLANDADFITNCNDRASLIIAGFRENYYMRTLYTMHNQFGYSLDLVSLPDETNWLMQSLSSRDFRLAALSCDANGVITDFTGHGLDDLLANRLTMIGCPKQRFKEDPVVLLRTIKYMVFGFTPDDLVLDALKTWQPAPDLDYSKLAAVTRKHLKSANCAQFFELFCQYDLTQKMFKITKKEDLFALLGINAISSCSSQLTFFSKAPNNHNGQVMHGVSERVTNPKL